MNRPIDSSVFYNKDFRANFRRIAKASEEAVAGKIGEHIPAEIAEASGEAAAGKWDHNPAEPLKLSWKP